MKYYICTFHSVHEALNFEKVLKDKKISHQMIPVPREISSSCGLSIKFALEDKEKLDQVITEHDLQFDNFFILEKRRKSLLDRK